MESFKVLSEIGLPTIVIVLVGIFGVIKGLESFIKWAKEKFMYFYNKKKGNEGFHKTVTNHDQEIKELKESQNALTNGMQILLKENLKKLHKEYMERSWVTSDELDDFIFQYNTYHSLGGNGTGTAYMNDVSKLEIRD